MEEFEKNESFEREEIFSKAVRAGKRTYFFDVKSTKTDDYYLTITERKRRYDQEGNFQIEKHKIFLYKEDFEKFSDGLSEVVDFIKSNKGEIEFNNSEKKSTENNFTNVDFEDLEH
ncbi:MAG: DUF3276 family protein [Bacteroidales bacterium]|nr:DUF3276 family protein [Bacteroidales bacterium]